VRINWFSRKTISGVHRCGITEFVPCALPDEAEEWGLMKIKRLTDAGMAEIGDDGGAPDTCEVL
jgi:hypothetical protein